MGRRGGTLDLQRRDHRGPIHRVHQQEESVPRHRPADRAPGQAPEPQERARGAGRAVRRLAPPRDLHRQPVPPGPGRTLHREHAQVEQVFADLEDSALAHLPSGKFTANAAWLTLAATAYDLTRAAGHLASVFHARARTGTIRRHLINIPARIATGARRLTLHLPEHWR
ncbi:transposase [Streptomyces sp. NBC_01017]|uniref:transposase n=1 Tax=Streptomyces sp. NBC_01017 TaxID=2903721 RepID=UPI00386906AB